MGQPVKAWEGGSDVDPLLDPPASAPAGRTGALTPLGTATVAAHVEVNLMAAEGTTQALDVARAALGNGTAATRAGTTRRTDGSTQHDQQREEEGLHSLSSWRRGLILFFEGNTINLNVCPWSVGGDGDAPVVFGVGQRDFGGALYRQHNLLLLTEL